MEDWAGAMCLFVVVESEGNGWLKRIEWAFEGICQGFRGIERKDGEITKGISEGTRSLNVLLTRGRV